MKRIVFICTGNACRSPLAATILQKKLADAGITDVEVSSAGTLDWGKNPRDERMADIAKEHGYHMSGETSYMTSELLDQADHIIVMSESHRNEVTKVLCYAHWARIDTFRNFCFGEQGGVTDPNGGTLSLYQSVFDIVEHGCERIAERLKGG